MSEWHKILLGTVSGLVIGIISMLVLDPFKQYITRKQTAKRARRVIYEDISSYYAICRASSLVPTLPSGISRDRLHIEAFDYYYDRHRDVFDCIPDRVGIRNVCSRLKLVLKGHNDVNPTLMLSLKEEIDYGIDSGELDGSQIRKMAAGGYPLDSGRPNM